MSRPLTYVQRGHTVLAKSLPFGLDNDRASQSFKRTGLTEFKHVERGAKRFPTNRESSLFLTLKGSIDMELGSNWYYRQSFQPETVTVNLASSLKVPVEQPKTGTRQAALPAPEKLTSDSSIDLNEA